MKIYALLILGALWPIPALSDTWVPITSEIPGMQLWTFPADSYEGSDNPFMRHCNSGKLIYVSILETPVKCYFKPHPHADGFYQMAISTNDKPISGQRLMIVSRAPIPPRAKLLSLSQEEIEKLKNAERASVAKYDRKIKNRFFGKKSIKPTEKDYVEYVREIKSSETYRKHIGGRFKLPSPNGFIYVSSIGLDSSEYIGWEIINVVYREIDGQMQEIGMFEGCIQGGFRDLDSDGTPEVLTGTCENGESRSDKYWTLVPKIKEVLAH